MNIFLLRIWPFKTNPLSTKTILVNWEKYVRVMNDKIIMYLTIKVQCYKIFGFSQFQNTSSPPTILNAS
jgi:hypothetical protein